MSDMKWQYDPIQISRLFMRQHAETYMRRYAKDGEYPSVAFSTTTRFAIDEATESEIEVAMLAYGTANGRDTISFDDPEEAIGILTHLMRQQRFIDYQLEREPVELGVYDAEHRTFTPCAFGAHWTTMLNILKKTDPTVASDLYDAKYNHPLRYHTESELDTLLLSRFTLVGGKYDASIKHTF